MKQKKNHDSQVVWAKENLKLSHSGSIQRLVSCTNPRTKALRQGRRGVWGLTNRSAIKVSKDAKIRNRYNHVPHLTQDTNGKVTNSQLDTTNESQEVSPFRAGDRKVQINRRVQMHSKHKAEKYERSSKEVPPWNGQ